MVQSQLSARSASSTKKQDSPWKWFWEKARTYYQNVYFFEKEISQNPTKTET